MPRRPLLILLAAAVVTHPWAAACAGEGTAASRVKAAFVCNFTQFVDWPADAETSPNGQFVLGVLCGGDNPDAADDALCDTLTQLAAGKTAAGGHPISVLRVTTVDDAAGCQALYVPPSQDGRLPALFAALAAKSVLTVGDTDAFAAAGGAIRFVPAGNKVRFEVHTPATGKAHLKVSSKLMKVAIVVDH